MYWFLGCKPKSTEPFSGLNLVPFLAEP